MSTPNLFNQFEPISTKQWKQQIQFELKGLDYNETLVWESPEGIKVKPFYHNDETLSNISTVAPKKPFTIIQNIFVHDVRKSNVRALDTLQRGAESIRFTFENDSVSMEQLMQNLPLQNITYYFHLPFLSIDLVTTIHTFATKNNATVYTLIDPIGHLEKEGNWFENLEKDFERLNAIASKTSIPFLTISSGIYQNAGANIVQQLA